jgi:hypothetical protein
LTSPFSRCQRSLGWKQDNPLPAAEQNRRHLEVVLKSFKVWTICDLTLLTQETATSFPVIHVIREQSPWRTIGLLVRSNPNPRISEWSNAGELRFDATSRCLRSGSIWPAKATKVCGRHPEGLDKGHYISAKQCVAAEEAGSLSSRQLNCREFPLAILNEP